jgi:hypothetical protein
MRSKQMNGRQHDSGSDFLKEIENNQRNVVWPGPLVNGRGVDEFFWKGSPNPTTVQRVATLLFAAVLRSFSRAWRGNSAGLG